MATPNVDYVKFHTSSHGVVKTRDDRVFDFWPSTGKWRDRCLNSVSKVGLADLILDIQGDKPEVKAEAHKSDMRVKLLNAQLGSVLRELAFLRAELQELRAELDR